MSKGHQQKRVLLTEIGSNSTGDELLYRSAARRFVEAGWSVSLLCRIFPRSPLTTSITSHVHELVVEDWFENTPTPDALAALFARRHPQAYARTRGIVEQHDLVAICPGGRFTSGYNNPRALLTASVALELGIPLVNLHQSFGPMDRRVHRKLLASVLTRSLVNLVRDDCSMDFLGRLGVPPGGIVATRDASFAEQCGGAGEVRFDVGLNIRHGFNGHLKPDVLRDFLLRLREARPHASVLVYSTTRTLDASVLTAISGLATADAAMPLPEHALAAPSSCRINISDSFHGVIFSMMARRAVVACQSDYSSWKIQGTRTPSVSDFNVLPGFTHRRQLAELLRETLRVMDDQQSVISAQDLRLAHGRERAEAGWRELFQRLATRTFDGT